MKIRLLLYAVFTFSSGFVELCAQENPSPEEILLKEALWKSGFEQVHVLDLNDTLRIFFEKRSFRYPVHSMEYAKLEASKDAKKAIVWIPVFHNRPMGAYHQEDYRFRKLKAEELSYFKKKNDLAGGYRFHFRIMPDFRARYGQFDQPFQTKTSLILDTRIYLLPGLSLHGGVLIPLVNSLDYREMNIRPGPTMLTWLGHQGNHFVNITGGIFLSDRYGIDLQYRYAPLDRFLSFGIESSLTGFYLWPSSGLYSEAMNAFRIVGDVEYRLPPFPKVTAKISAGQFLYGDRGVRFDLIRQWGSVDVSFYASTSDLGRNAGFQFIVPIFPGNILRTKKMEFRTTEEYPWDYNYSQIKVTRNYRLSVPRLSDVVRQYNHHLWIHE